MTSSSTDRPAAPPRLRVATRLKWRLFRILEQLADLRRGAAPLALEVSGAQPSSAPASVGTASRERGLEQRPAFWVFVSTIGELNAVDPLLRELVRRTRHLQLVLITDRPHYRDNYLASYPQALVCITRGHGSEGERLATLYPPHLLVVAEIPCLPHDAPCRFSFGYVYAARRCGAALAIVNGWLYGYTTSCRMDNIERRLFQRDFLRAFDVVCAQTEDTRTALLNAGAVAVRTHVVGNLKFDAMQRPDWDVSQARSASLLKALLASGRPVIVAGSVTAEQEQAMVLEAFLQLRQHQPQALLVLAPRHPEALDRMQALRAKLQAIGLPALFRSDLADAPLPADACCLVLDTMGDLRDFYAAASVAHVGVDHNLLEPLSFGKAVTTGTGWNPTYPSFPVYSFLRGTAAFEEADTPAELVLAWTSATRGVAAEKNDEGRRNALASACGSAERHLQSLSMLLSPRLNSAS